MHPAHWRDYRAVVMREIGGTRDEIDRMPWDEFTAEVLVARDLFAGEG